MKAKDINKAINWGLGFSAAYFIGTAIAGAIKKHRESGANGIGDIPAWNSNHIHNFLAYEHYGYPYRIVIDPMYQDHLGRKLVEAYPDDGRYSSRTFWVNKKNEEYLIELCKRYGVKVEYVRY